MEFRFSLDASKTGYICEGLDFDSKYIVSEISIPENYQGKPVIEIDRSAFQEYPNLEVIKIPKNVFRITGFCFIGSSKLNKIIVSEGNPYMSTRDGVLFDKEIELLIVYPEGKTNKKYEIPSTVQYIGTRAFINNQFLEEISIPKSVTSIKELAFGDHKLSYIFIPKSVQIIEDYAFSSEKNKDFKINTELKFKPQSWSNNWNSKNYQNSEHYEVEWNFSNTKKITNHSKQNSEKKEKDNKLIQLHLQKTYKYEIEIPKSSRLNIGRFIGKTIDEVLVELKVAKIKTKPKLVSENEPITSFGFEKGDELTQNIHQSNQDLIKEFFRIWNEFPHENFSQTIHELVRTIHNQVSSEDYEDYLPQNYRKKYFQQVGTKKSPDYEPIESLEEDRRDVESQAIKNWIFDMGNDELLGWLKKVVEFIGL